MKIKFESEDGYKLFKHGMYEFYATKRGRDGYSLEVYEWYRVEDKYLANLHRSKRVSIPYEAPCNIDRIRQRIIEIITK